MGAGERERVVDLGKGGGIDCPLIDKKRGWRSDRDQWVKPFHIKGHLAGPGTCTGEPSVAGRSTFD